MKQNKRNVTYYIIYISERDIKWQEFALHHIHNSKIWPPIHPAGIFHHRIDNEPEWKLDSCLIKT